VVGLVALVLLAPERAQLRVAAGAAVLAAAGGALAAALPAVRTMAGARDAEGLILLAGLAVLAAAGAWAAARVATTDAGAVSRLVVAPPDDGATAGRPGAASRPDARRVRLGAIAAVAVVGIALVAGSAAVESGTPRDGATAARLGSADSNRYAYWRVALDGFADAPLQGHGAGSFGVLWLRDRTVPEVVRDAHSLWLETAAELGIVGLLLLGGFVGGVGWSAAIARRRDAARLAGPAAALSVWAAHSAIDWDWELPGGPTLTAIVLAGVVIALADARDERRAR
jgi:O-antigen ligase